MTLESEVQTWLDANWIPDITVGEWWARLAGAGYARPTWPDGLGGRSMTASEARCVSSVLAKAGVIAAPVGHVGATLAAPTILAHGDENQKGRFVAAIARGDEAWCQLFSEPGSGSDLASVGTTAVLDGDEWVVNGQKVWNSAADNADLGMLLARTDPDQPKHRGITYFAIDMRQPGIEVRPLRQMNGGASFCEVFLTNARVGRDRMIGALNDGWRVAQTTLAAERASVAGGTTSGLIPVANANRELTVREVIERFRSPATASSIKSNAVPWKVMLELAQGLGRTSDPVLRQDLVRYHVQVRVNGWLMQRVARAKGALTGADGSLAKLSTSRICQQSRELSYRIVGASGMLWGTDSPMEGELQFANLASPGTRIGGGTDEIQLNVLGERGLGLPREPADDRDIPYRQLRVGTQR